MDESPRKSAVCLSPWEGLGEQVLSGPYSCLGPALECVLSHPEGQGGQSGIGTGLTEESGEASRRQ